jgi:hypothetical protein
MNTKNLVRTLVLLVTLVGISAGYVRADKLELQKKLSEDIDIKLNDVPIAEALKVIGEKAGVKFVLSDEAVWKLPQGEATRLSGTLDGPLAGSITEMLKAFFMRHVVGDYEVTIYPRPELEHILGRPTTKQLELLKRIYTAATSTYIKGNIPATINGMVGEEILILPVGEYGALGTALDGIIVPEQDVETGKVLVLSTQVTLAQLLNEIGSSWYLSGMDFPNQGPRIKIVHELYFREMKLNQIVDISFKDEKPAVIIQRLAKLTGMDLIIIKMADDPSWLEDENISVKMQNIKLKQALLNIISSVGGGVDFEVGANEIHVIEQIRPKKPAAPRKTQSGSKVGGAGYVGKISIPMDGGKYYIEFMLRESDLTEELKNLRAKKIEEILGKAPGTTQATSSKK